MTKITFFFIFHFFTTQIFCQNFKGETKYSKKDLDKVNFVYTNIYDVFNVYNPSINLGYGRCFSSKISVQGEFGLVIPRSAVGLFLHTMAGFDSSLPTFSGFKIRTEMRYYLEEFRPHFYNNKINQFFGLEIFYTKTI